MGVPRSESPPTHRRINRDHVRRGAGLGQLSLVEHALCPLDTNASLKENVVFAADYFFTDKNHHQQKAHASVVCPFGLSAGDEFFLWGLLALTFAQPESESELHATPHYCLRQLGLIDMNSRRGGRQYDQFRHAIERLSTVTYRNDRFYDPVRAEHRRVNFGFLSYSLPLDPESSRAWRLAWDPLFFEFVAACGGHFRFDLEIYRELDSASRRLFMFVSKVFARRETTPRLNIRHLGEHVIGFSPTLDTRNMKIKIARAIRRLSEAGVVEPSSGLFQKHGAGDYSVTLIRGPYFARRHGQAINAAVRESAVFGPLLALGLDESTAERLIRQYPPRLLREWSDITLAAKERFGASFFTRSPQAYFVDNLKSAAVGTRTPPDWWHDIRKAEHAASELSIRSTIGNVASDDVPNDPVLGEESLRLFERIRDDLFARLIAGGETKRDAWVKAARLARDHVAKRDAARTPALSKLGSLIRSQIR